ncbi:MAG: hypothetical protein K9W44_05020 [Candidatus Lokiarchaeota archaeon]|nr:hypothetical protein [Candidatus Harpocratesius repetitus]
MDTKIFDYEKDWFNYFQQYIQNIDINKKKRKKRISTSIKTNIIESNQTLDSLIKSWNNKRKKNPAKLILHESREKYFKTLELKTEEKQYFFYIKQEVAEIPRFWIIYNKEPQTKIKKYIQNIFQDFYKQDSIYLTNTMMKSKIEEDDIFPGGFSLNFEQSFIDDSIDENIFDDEDDDDNYEENEEDEGEEEKLRNSMGEGFDVFQDPTIINNLKYSLRLWAGTPHSFENTLKSLYKADLPINYKSLMCYFKDEDNSQILKEEFTYKGGFTVNNGTDFSRHIEFVNDILDTYREKLNEIESYRYVPKENKGKLIQIIFDDKIKRKNFVKRLNNISSLFKLYFTNLYSEINYDYYRVADLHNGDHFYAQVFDDKIYLNLHKNCCGNNVFRLFTNLQKYFSPNISIEIDGTTLQM